MTKTPVRPIPYGVVHLAPTIAPILIAGCIPGIGSSAVESETLDAASANGDVLAMTRETLWSSETFVVTPEGASSVSTSLYERIRGLSATGDRVLIQDFGGLVRDRLTGIDYSIPWERAKGDSQATFEVDSVESMSLSRDGNVVLFPVSGCPCPNQTGQQAAYLYDIAADRIERIDVGGESMSTEVSNAFFAVASSDGLRIAFNTATTTVGPFGTPAQRVYLRDRVAGTTTLVSVSSSGEPSMGDTWDIAQDITADGSKVLFKSSAANLTDVPFEGWGLFVRDTIAQTTELVSVGPDGSPVRGLSEPTGLLSPDGNFVAFEDGGTAWPGPQSKLFIRDLHAATTTEIDLSSVTFRDSTPFNIHLVAVSDGASAVYFNAEALRGLDFFVSHPDSGRAFRFIRGTGELQQLRVP